ncbi:MAG: transcriptional regulator [Rhodococcus sp.]|nr:transcriptional regulator [Rhodococcus sp. (in: high G+C Gram-positive bacteria)]
MKTGSAPTTVKEDAATASSNAAVTGTSPVFPAAAPERQTRRAVVQLLLEEGPITATQIGQELGLSAAGVRRHIDALMESGEAQEAAPAVVRHRGRGRPAKQFQITAQGRAKLSHAYDDLAGAALRQLREIGGDAAIMDFARRRVQALLGSVTRAVDRPQSALAGSAGADDVPADDVPADDVSAPGEAAAQDVSADEVKATADDIAGAFNSAGFAATTRPVGGGVQICQHHCPVSHVAEEFPELCEAEREAFTELLGTHVQQLATIANGDCACTTHVPLTSLSPVAPVPVVPVPVGSASVVSVLGASEAPSSGRPEPPQ